MQRTYDDGATARWAMTTRGTGIFVPTVGARKLRHDEYAQTDARTPTQAHRPWLTNPAAAAQASGSLSGCHFCILPRRGSLLEPATQLPGPLALVVVRVGPVCDVHERVLSVQALSPAAGRR